MKKRASISLWSACGNMHCNAVARYWLRHAVLLLAAMLAQASYAQTAQTARTPEAGLNFVGADIAAVVSAIGQYTNTTFILDPRVRGTINLVSDGPVSKEQALRLLTSTLRLQGFAVVPDDGFSKVVPEADAKLQAASPQPTVQSAARSNQIATQIFRLNYESAANLVPVLRPLISPNNTINANPGNNTLIVTDYGDNLRRIGKIIATLDTPAASEIEVIPIRYAMATDIALMLNRLMEPVAAAGGTQGAEAGRLNALADPRINAVVLRAPSLARANLAKALITKLDQPTALPGNVHVVPLKNAEAVKLAQTLRSIVLANNPNAQDVGNTPQSQQSQQQNNQPTSNVQAAAGGLQTDNSTLMNSTPLNNNQPAAALPAGGRPDLSRLTRRPIH